MHFASGQSGCVAGVAKEVKEKDVRWTDTIEVFSPIGSLPAGGYYWGRFGAILRWLMWVSVISWGYFDGNDSPWPVPSCKWQNRGSRTGPFYLGLTVIHISLLHSWFSRTCFILDLLSFILAHHLSIRHSHHRIQPFTTHFSPGPLTSPLPLRLTRWVVGWTHLSAPTIVATYTGIFGKQLPSLQHPILNQPNSSKHQ